MARNAYLSEHSRMLKLGVEDIESRVADDCGSAAGVRSGVARLAGGSSTRPGDGSQSVRDQPARTVSSRFDVAVHESSGSLAWK